MCLSTRQFHSSDNQRCSTYVSCGFFWFIQYARVIHTTMFVFFPIKSRCVSEWVSEWGWLCVCEAVDAEKCTLGVGSFQSYQCVCGHVLFPSTHGLSLCVRQYICDVSVFRVLRCAVDFGVEPALCLCFWCVSVVFVYCGCTALACLDWTGLNSQGWVCQRFLLHPSNTADNLEFISVWWMRDYLSAIRLLGSLSQTPRWFPLSLLPLALMSNSESYFSDLHIAPKLEHQSIIGKCGDIWSNEMGWTHLSKDEDNSVVLKWKSQFLWPLARQTIWSIVFPLVMLLNACALKICIFPFLLNFLNAWQTFLFSFARHLKVCIQSWYSWLLTFMNSTSMLDTAKLLASRRDKSEPRLPSLTIRLQNSMSDGSRGETL